MDYKTAKSQGLIKSGNIIAFKKPRNLLEKWIEIWTGKYYHVGMLYVDPVENKVYLYEALFKGLQKVEFTAKEPPFDVIETGIDFNRDVKRFADSLLGEKYSWINFFLVCIGKNSDKFGYICSTLVGAILTVAHDEFKTSGLTPSQLIRQLEAKKCNLFSIDS